MTKREETLTAENVKEAKRTAPIKTSAHTNITHELDYKFHAPHKFHVVDNDGKVVDVIEFQMGGIHEVGVNGVMNEDLLTMVKIRLEAFQNSPFACEENQEALDFVNKAIEASAKRTAKRLARGVEGTHVV